jgi:CBS-domain-containing membrane protein
VWGPLAAGALIILIGALGVYTNQPLLFPSLGPTAFLQVEDPELRVARLYNTVVGHVVGMAAGLAAVFLLRIGRAPSPMVTGVLTADRILASTLAVALTIALGLLLRASHPPACATTLLFALGGFAPTLHVVLTVLAGVLLIGLTGEVLRRFRLGKVKKLPV